MNKNIFLLFCFLLSSGCSLMTMNIESILSDDRGVVFCDICAVANGDCQQWVNSEPSSLFENSVPFDGECMEAERSERVKLLKDDSFKTWHNQDFDPWLTRLIRARGKVDRIDTIAKYIPFSSLEEEIRVLSSGTQYYDYIISALRKRHEIDFFLHAEKAFLCFKSVYENTQNYRMRCYALNGIEGVLAILNKIS